MVSLSALSASAVATDIVHCTTNNIEQEQVEDGVKDRSPAVEPRPSTAPGTGQVRFEERPLGV
jgi:hypothetical protein